MHFCSKMTFQTACIFGHSTVQTIQGCVSALLLFVNFRFHICMFTENKRVILCLKPFHVSAEISRFVCSFFQFSVK